MDKREIQIIQDMNSRILAGTTRSNLTDLQIRAESLGIDHRGLDEQALRFMVENVEGEMADNEQPS